MPHRVFMRATPLAGGSSSARGGTSGVPAEMAVVGNCSLQYLNDKLF